MRWRAPYLYTDIYSAGVLTWRDDLHGYRHPPRSRYPHRFDYRGNYRDVLTPQAVSAVSASRDELLDLFERIENVFRRLEIYIEVPPTKGMADAIVKVMVEVLCILAIVTKEIKQSRASESTVYLALIVPWLIVYFTRNICEEVGRKEGHRGRVAEARKSDGGRSSDGGCGSPEGYTRRWRQSRERGARHS